MASLGATVADALMASLAGETYSQSIASFSRKSAAAWGLNQLTTARVTLQIVGLESEPLDRTRNLDKYTFDIAVQKFKEAGFSEAEVDALNALVEDELRGFIDDLQDFTVSIGGGTYQAFSIEGSTNPVIYSPEDLRDSNLFTAVMRVQYQVVNPGTIALPVAAFNYDIVSGTVVDFDASSSVAYGGRTITAWQWTGSVTSTDGPIVQLDLDPLVGGTPGDYPVGLIVTDSGGNVSAVTSQTITVP